VNDIYIIAEIGNVHDGSFGNARKLIELAAECGADCIKFQTHIPGAETTRDAPTPPYFRGEPRYDYFLRTGFSEGEWMDLKNHADDQGIDFLSSPFSDEAVELLHRVGITKFKIPSGEVTNLPMLEKIAATGKQVLLSSGMSNWHELDQAVGIIRKFHDDIVIMQCTSLYPCPPEKTGLNIIQQMRDRWGLPVGFSDHTSGNSASFAAAALGACVIEKHLTFSKKMYGSDAANSSEPDQFRGLVSGIREISRMVNHPLDKDDISDFAEMKRVFEKSVVSTTDIERGIRIEAHMVAIKKPGTGISPSKISSVVGSVAARHIPADSVIMEDYIINPQPRMGEK